MQVSLVLDSAQLVFHFIYAATHFIIVWPEGNLKVFVLQQKNIKVE